MVVSLTIIPVLAARFLAQRPMPTTRPDLQRAGRRLRRACFASGLRFPRPVVLLALLGGRAGWLVLAAPRSGLHAGDGRRGVRPRLLHAGRHVAGADRQGAAPRRRRAAAKRPTSPATSAAPARRTGCSPPNRSAATSWSASKPPGQRRPMEEIFDELREELEGEVPELETEFVPLIQDQINDLSGVQQADRGQGLRPRPGRAARPGREGRQDCRRGRRPKDVNAHVHLGNPDIVVRPDSVADGPRRPDASRTSRTSSTRPCTGKWPARCPSRTASPNIRVRYPDAVRYDPRPAGRVADQPCRGAPRPAATPRRSRRRPALRAARATGLDRAGAQPQRAVAREPAAGDHRDGRAGRPRPGQPSIASLQTRAGQAEVSARLSLGVGRRTIGRSRNRSPAC